MWYRDCGFERGDWDDGKLSWVAVSWWEDGGVLFVCRGGCSVFESVREIGVVHENGDGDGSI